MNSAPSILHSSYTANFAWFRFSRIRSFWNFSHPLRMTNRFAQEDSSLMGNELRSHSSQTEGLNGAPDRAARRALTVLVFPVALFAFGDPFEGGCDSFVTSFGALGFGDPFDVFAFAAGAEGGEGG